MQHPINPNNTTTNTALDSPTSPTKDPVFTGLQHCPNQQLKPTYRGIDSADLLKNGHAHFVKKTVVLLSYGAAKVILLLAIKLRKTK